LYSLIYTTTSWSATQRRQWRAVGDRKRRVRPRAGADLSGALPAYLRRAERAGVAYGAQWLARVRPNVWRLATGTPTW